MDSGWIKALELPAKITGAICVACSIVLLIDGSDALKLDEIGAWVRPSVMVLWIGTGCLFAFSAISSLWTATTPQRQSWLSSQDYKRKRQTFIDDIPYLTDKERIILGYLRHHKQKRFTFTQDGGYAGTLVAKGYIQLIGVRGQTARQFEFPFEVSSFVWEVIEERPDDFPHMPKFSGKNPKVETHPWAIPWGL